VIGNPNYHGYLILRFYATSEIHEKEMRAKN